MRRRLSEMERSFVLLDQGSSFNGVQVVHLLGPMTADLLRAGLKWAQARHPLLRARLAGDPDRPLITDEGAGPIPVECLALGAHEGWQRVVERELNRRFGLQDDHLARVILVEEERGAAIVFAHHHVTADAVSVVWVLRDVLAVAAAIVAGRDPGPAIPLPERPPMPAMLPREARGLRSFAAMQHFFWKHIVSGPFRRASRLPPLPYAPPAERTNRIVAARLRTDETSALAARARAEGTTVQGALCAALLQAAGKSLGRTAVLGCFSAVSLRDKLVCDPGSPPLGDEMGLYISQVTTFHRVSAERAFWDLAREVKAQLALTIGRGEQYLTMPLIGLFIPWGRGAGRRFVRRFDLGSPAAVGVTNVGRLPLEEHYGPFTVHGYDITVGVSVVSQLAVAASTFAGALSVNLLYASPLVSGERARALSQAMLDALRGGIGSGRALAAVGDLASIDRSLFQ